MKITTKTRFCPNMKMTPKMKITTKIKTTPTKKDDLRSEDYMLKAISTIKMI